MGHSESFSDRHGLERSKSYNTGDSPRSSDSRHGYGKDSRRRDQSPRSRRSDSPSRREREEDARKYKETQCQFGNDRYDSERARGARAHDRHASVSASQTSRRDSSGTSKDMAPPAPPTGPKNGWRAEYEGSRNGPDSSVKVSDIVTLLGSYGDDIARKLSLQARVDRAKVALDESQKQFEQSRAHHLDFPTIQELHANKIAKAQSVFNELDDKLKVRRAELSKTILSLAEIISAKQTGVGQTNLSAADGSEDAWQARVERDFDNLKQRCQTEFGMWRSDWSGLQEEVKRCVSKASKNHDLLLSLQKDLTEYKQEKIEVDVEKSKDEISSREVARDLKIKLDKLSQKVNHFSSNEVEISKALGDLDSWQKACSARLDQMNTLTSTVSSFAPTQTRMEETLSRLDGDFREIATSLTTVQEESTSLKQMMGIIDRKVATLESDTQPGRFTSNLAATDISTFRANIEELQTSIAGVKAGQAAADEFFGTLVDGLQNKCDTVEKAMALATNTYKQNVIDTNKHLQKLENSSEALKTDLLAMKNTQSKIRDADRQSQSQSPGDAPINSPTTFSPPSLQLVNSHLDAKTNAIKEDLKSTFQDELGSLQMVVRNLDSRFSNLQTEHLAKYIIGQLQTFYPNVANLDGMVNGMSKDINHNTAKIHGLTERMVKVEANPVLVNNGASIIEVANRNIHNLEINISELVQAQSEIHESMEALGEAQTASQAQAQSYVTDDTFNVHVAQTVNQFGDVLAEVDAVMERHNKLQGEVERARRITTEARDIVNRARAAATANGAAGRSDTESVSTPHLKRGDSSKSNGFGGPHPKRRRANDSD